MLRFCVSLKYILGFTVAIVSFYVASGGVEQGCEILLETLDMSKKSRVQWLDNLGEGSILRKVVVCACDCIVPHLNIQLLKYNHG